VPAQAQPDPDPDIDAGLGAGHLQADAQPAITEDNGALR
jgi:hypothetical protein